MFNLDQHFNMSTHNKLKFNIENRLTLLSDDVLLPYTNNLYYVSETNL